MDTHPGKAFQGEARRVRLLSSAKAVWWSGHRAIGRMLTSSGDEESQTPTPAAAGVPPIPRDRLKRAWLDAFRKDADDVAAGLYPATERGPADPIGALRISVDVLRDARTVAARRRRGGRVEARHEPGSAAYPNYYRQNFHYQSGGWFTPESARRYEAQVEALFAGAAGPMRRRALSLMAKAWRNRSHRDLTIVDLACGSGAFLTDLHASFPRARLMGVDLSHPYARTAKLTSGRPVIQATAERLPFPDASLDAVSCIYLFHELPPRTRLVVAQEIGRVLKPGGVLAFADSVQTEDAPEFGQLLQAFPTLFHEPYFASYQDTSLQELFASADLTFRSEDAAFLTKALLFIKS